MSIIRKNYFDIGKNGTADQFFRELQKAAKSRRYSAPDKLNALVKGAGEAFAEGRPENIQTVFHKPRAIEFGGYFSPEHYHYFAFSTLRTKKISDQSAVIELALAKASAEDKQEILNLILGTAVCHHDAGYFVTALLEAGADATADCDYPYSSRKIDMLGEAVSHDSWSAVKDLHAHGASFDVTRQRMLSAGWDEHSIDKLEFYREALEGKPGIVEIEASVLEQMQEQIRELTTKLERTTVPNAEQPQEIKRPQNKLRLMPRI